jgi:hypothetical protein
VKRSEYLWVPAASDGFCGNTEKLIDKALVLLAGVEAAKRWHSEFPGVIHTTRGHGTPE